jgi:NTP pyrophosphatase (non-canonical NTP hydrolase)
MNHLTHATLTQLQAYVADMELRRGFSTESAQDKCLLLTEEVGELCKAIRKHHTAIKTDVSANPQNVGDELADVLIYLLSIANITKVDLGEALVAKETKNEQRKWA